MNKEAAQKALDSLRKNKYPDLEKIPKIKNPKRKSPGKVGKEKPVPPPPRVYPTEDLPSRPGKCMSRTLSRQKFCDLDLGHPSDRHVNYELGISWNL